MSKFFIVMGRSATGKDSIFKRIVESEELLLITVVPYTTRPMRKNETNGVEYFFVDIPTMDELKRQNKIIEHRSYPTIHGEWHYFTVNDGQIDLSTSDYIMIGTLETYDQVCEYYDHDTVIPIYIEVEDGLRLSRALNREIKQENPKYAELCRRYLADEEDFSEENIKKSAIVKRYYNIDMNTCVRDIIDDIKEIIMT